jgi:hypothetical protein
MRGRLNASLPTQNRRLEDGIASSSAVFAIALIGYLAVSFSAKAEGQATTNALQSGSVSAVSAIRSHVEEASRRFLIPSSWIWAVIRVESAGDVRALSNKGAVGLMQLMPKTWASLRQQHGLGVDPYDPRDNILAGAAYLRELHDRYGEVGFLAAYNAGPGRYEDHLSGRHTLPAETVDYVAKVSRRIGKSTAAGDQMDVSDGIPARGSDLFPRSHYDPKNDHLTDEKPSKVRSSSNQNVVDLSALTPLSSGLFVTLSSY